MTRPHIMFSNVYTPDAPSSFRSLSLLPEVSIHWTPSSIRMVNICWLVWAIDISWFKNLPPEQEKGTSV